MPDFKFPTASDYANATGIGLKELDSELQSRIPAPYRASVASASAVFKAVTGKPPGEFLADKAAEGVQVIMSEIIEGTTELSGDVQSLVTSVMSTASDIAAAIPYIGLVVSIFMKGMQAILAQPQLSMRELKENAYKDYVQLCQYGFNATRIDTTPTGPGGQLYPADIFLPNATWDGLPHDGPGGRAPTKTGESMPPNMGSTFILLVGGEQRGLVGPSREAYARWLSSAQSRFGQQIGIDLETRRKLWTLIESVVSAIREPTIGSANPGDGGRLMMPFVNELLLKEYRKGTWTKESLADLWCFMMGTEKTGWACTPYGAAQQCVKHVGNCCDVFPNGAEDFYKYMMGWSVSSEDLVIRWNRGEVQKQREAMNRLVLKPSTLNFLREKIETAYEAERTASSKNIGLAIAGGVSATYVASSIYDIIGKKR